MLRSSVSLDEAGFGHCNLRFTAKSGVYRQVVCVSSLGIRFKCLLVFVVLLAIHREGQVRAVSSFCHQCFCLNPLVPAVDRAGKLCALGKRKQLRLG